MHCIPVALHKWVLNSSGWLSSDTWLSSYDQYKKTPKELESKSNHLIYILVTQLITFSVLHSNAETHSLINVDNFWAAMRIWQR